ncbi:hypothetical protein ACMGGR_08490 [Erwinia sp. BNK-24-b]|uniref:hypothetical protein n=1 Tax=Erwinia TaxID=551 RepID=UPI001FEDEB49|nr:hypothetical protein [Erwinia phyllosphaerae]MBV4365040.1 hypothetical protein [Erwinia phyllosphaerae]
MMEEIISYVYPTLLREGMSASETYPPQLSITPDTKDGTHTLAVTAAFILQQVGMYYMEVGVYRHDESVIASPSRSGLIETKFYEQTQTSRLLTIYSMIASGVDLSVEGIYRISVKAYRSKDGIRNELPAAENECFFYVSYRA